MLTVKVELVDGVTECFETSSYVMGPLKDMHPKFLKVKVYSQDGKLMKKISRPFKFWYKKVTYKTEKVQKILRKIESRRPNKDLKS